MHTHAPPPFVLSAVETRRATLIGERKVTFTGNVNNLTNKKYWGLGNIGEGINGFFSVRVDW